MFRRNLTITCSAIVLLAAMLLTGGVQAELFPAQNLYPIYIADPLRPTFNAQLQRYEKIGIASTGNNRFDLKLGANLPLYEWQRASRPWQLVLIAGFHGQFDNTPVSYTHLTLPTNREV